MAASSFLNTRWSVIKRAASTDSSTKDRGLAEFCEAYWMPLFAYLRRRGRSGEAASDLVQGFFCALLERDGLSSVKASDGDGGSRFRSWLLTSLQNYERDVHALGAAEKRGGALFSYRLTPSWPREASVLKRSAARRPRRPSSGPGRFRCSQ
ncbi:hypothetical protein Poly30_28290 [Planctomycetes bacterium Poly30]|uniref:RNA polymerase sigma factor n=1 Tax=Saltatorellus ferox TaxID=2528018 RepID=A0A518ET85_9BACT|nr:hypothetical protein Poly30_28290 [Planctomycetes bacterium Poly30]